MPKETNSKNLFFKKSFTTHLGGSSSSLDQDSQKSKETSNNHEVDSSNGDSEVGSVGVTDTDDVADVVEPHPETVEQPDEVVSNEAVSDSPQSKPGKRPIRCKRPDEGLRSQASKTPREQKSYRPNKEGSRKSLGRSGPMSSHQYRGPGHHHNRPHPAQAYPGHPMAGMFPGPPIHNVHPIHPQQYVSEHLSQSPLETGFVVPIHSPRRTPRHSESSSCGSPVFGGIPYQGPNQSPYHSPPPTSPRMSNYYESPPVQVPIMHHPRFQHHMSPYNSPPNAPSPLNYTSRSEIHAQGMAPQQRYTQQEMLPAVHQMMIPGRIPIPNQVPISQNMMQMEPEYMMQVSHPSQMRSQHTPPDQQMLMQQQMWQMQQQRMQQSMIQQQDQQSQQNQNMMVQQQMAQQMAQQIANMQQMFTPDQMQQMMAYMQQQQQMAGQLLFQQQQQQQQQKQLPQNHLQQVQSNMLMNTPMGHMMPGQEMVQQFPNAAIAQFTRPSNQPQPQFQNIQNMQQHLSLLNIAAQQQPIPFSQANRNPQFMAPRFPPPMPPSISTENLSRSTPADPAIITTISDPTVFGGPGSAFVDHTTSEQSRISPIPPPPPIPKSDVPSPHDLPLDEDKEEETPVPKVSSIDPMANITEPPKKNTPGIIHLPPTLPTEEDMMKSPDSTSGTPISMKKNYWQRRKKSSDESPTTTHLMKNLVAETANMKDVTEKEEVEKISPPIDVPEPENSTSPVVTPKKSAHVQKGKDPKPFYLSDLGALVSESVIHNNKLPKTSIPSGVGNVEVIPSESMIRSVKNKEFRRSQEHKDTHWRAHDVREGGKKEEERWRPASRENREKDVETSNWRDKPKDPKEEDERRISLLKEAESKGMSDGEQIAYALKKLEGKSPKPKRPSESSVVEDNQLEGVPNWYDDDEDDLNPFDLNI